MFVKFSQAKTYSEASLAGLLATLVDGRSLAVEQDRQSLSRANREGDEIDYTARG
jgi:hypothetical protein